MRASFLLAALLLSSAASAFDGIPVTRTPPDNMPVIGRPYRPGTDGVPSAPKVPPAALCACPIPLASANAKLVTRQVKLDAVPLQRWRDGRAVRLEVIIVGADAPLSMLLDTGASASQISVRLANQLVEAGKAHFTGRADVLLANGSTHNVWMVSIDTVIVGQHTVHNVLASTSVGGETILGFPVLDSIAPFTIDTRSAQLIFHP